MIVYMATNTKNGKVYIGATVSRLKRISCFHKSLSVCGGTYPFHCAIRRYGFHNFTWQILWRCQSVSEMFELKEQFIIEYNSMDDGYNETTGGIHFKMSDNVCKKLSAAGMGSVCTEETKQKIRLSRLGHSHSEATKKKIKDNHVGTLGMRHSAKSIKKISESSRKYHAKNTKELLEKYSKRTEKKCCACKEIKPLDMFYKNNHTLDKLCYRCKNCERNRIRP